MGIVEQYLLQLNKEKRRWRRAAAILTVLSLLVSIGVSWNLRMTGVTIANGATCGQEEHQHTESCPMEKVLICGYDGDELPAEAMDGLPEESVDEPVEEMTEDFTEELPEESMEEPVEEPEEEPIEEAAEESVEEYSEIPEEFIADAEAEAEADMQEDTVLDVVMSAAADVFSGVIPVAHAAEISEESLPEESGTGHIHTDECYEITWLCGLEEHIHSLSCYSDTTADIETAVIWEADLPELTGDWADDLVLVAQSQLGCGESARNYIIADDDVTRNGITRYGQWYGNPYGDWSSMFMLFCLHYAEIPQEAVPWSPGVYNMMRLMEDGQIFLQPDENLGSGGNLLFLDTDENGNADRIAVVTAYEEEEITAISGDWDNEVAEITFADKDPGIMGYVNVRQLQEAWETREEEPSEPTEPDATEPVDEMIPDETKPDETTPDETTPDETTPDETTPDETTPDETKPDETKPDETTPDETKPDDTAPGETTPDEQSDAPAISLNVEFPEEGILQLTAQISNMNESMFAWQWQVSEDGNEPWTDIEGATDLVCELEDTEENFNRYYRLQGRKVAMRFMARAPVTVSDSSGAPEDNNTITSEPIAPFSIIKNSNVYTVNVYALPVDADGNRIKNLDVTDQGTLKIDSTTKQQVENLFDDGLGIYKSAYFGSETSVTINNIKRVWRYKSGSTYYLAYEQTNGTTNYRWKNNTDTSISLYLRYEPRLTVNFESEGFDTISETVKYNGILTVTEPSTWTREEYTLVGWTEKGSGQTVYTFDKILQEPVIKNITYEAKWMPDVMIRFDLGIYDKKLYPVAPMSCPYGGTIALLPVPIWKNNDVAMAFDGWYRDSDLTEAATNSTKFYEDTTLYAKWSPKEDGYYVYFMDFEREGQAPVVLASHSVTKDHTTSPYTPSNPPAETEWDEKWYLDSSCQNVYDFLTPVSDMTDDLTGANGRDLYLYPGTKEICRAIFVTYGTKVDPVAVPVGSTINLDQYRPERDGYEFAGWKLKDGTKVSGTYTLSETTTFYASWDAGYVSFEAILRIENANDTGMTQADILGTWYAKSGSHIRVKSTYSGSGTNRKGTHEVVCVVDGTEYPVYNNAAMTQKATLNDVYATYFIYNNTGTNWTDEVNWDDVYTGGEVPYSTRPISSAGDTIINFDYMRVRNDIVFTIPNTNSGGYIDVYKLQQSGLITGSVFYSGTKPTSTGQNVSATGVSSENISWSYTAASRVGSSYNNYYTLHNMKYGQRIYEVYPVGGSWLTARSAAYHQYKVGSGQLFSSRRQDLTSDFFSGSGRGLTPYSLTVEFENQEYIALMYAVECLAHETPDFTLNGVGYKVDTELCEVVKHTGYFAIKDLDGCSPGVNALGTYSGNNKYYTANTISSGQRNYAVAMNNAKIGNTSVYTLFNETYWPYYAKFNGVQNIKTFAKAYIFYYDRLHMNIQFNFGYDSDGNGANETVKYENIAYGERIGEYQYAKPDYAKHPLLEREGYEFAGWLDSNGFVMGKEDWESIVASGDSENSTMIFIAKWEKISNNIVEYYEDRSSTEPFETHYFEDGELFQYPTMAVYPGGWVWQESGAGQYDRFDWDVPMYGEYGVKEEREINGEKRAVNVIRIYGTWDESHTKVVYDPNAAQGGIAGTAPTDDHEYTVWQSDVPVAARGETANADPNMIFVGWQLDRNGIVYQPGDHVPVRWPRTMIFTAQWAKREEIVFLRYDPNGGTPEEFYPNDSGFSYRKNATAAVWDNKDVESEDWFSRTGYVFTGWNTQPDGSGTAYAPDASILLTEPLTTLYAQWKKTTYDVNLNKVDSENRSPLSGAEFGLYKQEDGMFLLVQSSTTGENGRISFTSLEMDTLYKLVEEKPPDGYAIISKEIYFAVRPGDNSVSLKFYDAAGREISHPDGASGEYITAHHILTLTVKNLRGYELPSTGGMGVHLYILCGLLLMAAPLVYGLSLWRKRERGASS